MRSDTHNTREHLLEKLHNAAGVIKIQHDGSDFVMVELWTGEKIVLYIVETYMSLHEIKTMLAQHTERGWYTLFLFWCDMLLPGDGELFPLQDWMAALLPLYNDKIYGFDVYQDREVYIFPVYFESQPNQRERLIHYGRTVDFDRLLCEEIHTDYTPIKGFWKIASFSLPENEADQPHEERRAAPFRTTLQVYYDILEISPDADLEMIKTAYRQLARQYHPDLNAAPEAHAKMQQINEAYRQLMDKLNG